MGIQHTTQLAFALPDLTISSTPVFPEIQMPTIPAQPAIAQCLANYRITIPTNTTDLLTLLQTIASLEQMLGPLQPNNLHKFRKLLNSLLLELLHVSLRHNRLYFRLVHRQSKTVSYNRNPGRSPTGFQEVGFLSFWRERDQRPPFCLFPNVQSLISLTFNSRRKVRGNSHRTNFTTTFKTDTGYFR